MRIILLLSACLSSIVPLEDDELTGNFRSTKSPLFMKNWFEAATELSVGKRRTDLIPNAKCLSFNNRTYCFIKSWRTFGDAEEFCEKYNLSLVHVKNYEHNVWLTVHARDISRNNWWIGIKDTYEEPRIFRWINKMPLNYTNWAADMPTTIRSDLYVSFMSGFWYTNDYNSAHNFICEGNSSFCPHPVMENTECHVYQDRAHFFITSKRHYPDANKYCGAAMIHGHLVIIQDENHNKWLLSKIPSPNHWYIGLEDSAYREYRWLDNGQNITNQYIYGHRVRGYTEHYDCVFLSTDRATWKAGDCNYKNNFICFECETVNGKWDNWTEWSNCSKTCGGGNQNRSRSCDNPKPQYGGSNCTGNSTENQSCNEHHCPFKLRLENLDEQELHNNATFDNGDVVQCSPLEPGIIKYVWINVSCGRNSPAGTAFVENCTEGELPCQTNVYFFNPLLSTCTLICDGMVHTESSGGVKFRVIPNEILIRQDNKIRLTLEDVYPIDGNIRESNYRVKCVANRIDNIKFLSIKRNCAGLTKTEYCDDRRNCEITISVDNIAHCNISCHADFYENVYYNKLIIDWRIICITPQWNEWSDCTETCGTGWQTRERSCIRSVHPDDDDLPCYEADSRECVNDKICDVPNEDPPFYFKPRKPRTATIQYIWDITPSDDSP